MKQMKIIPLLVFVAMLAFSVRLVEVVAGVSAMSGSAFAQQANDEPSDENLADVNGGSEEASARTAQSAGGSDTPNNQGGVSENDKSITLAAADIEEDEEASPWRDPSDEDPGYEAVREELFDDLSNRRKEIEALERELQTREALLKVAEQEIDRKFQELSQLRQEIEGLLETQSEEEKARVQSLVRIYEGMKPKDAARIFDTLDLDVLVAVVASMGERKLSPVLAAMNAERARTVTIMLAEQKKLPTLPQSN